MMKLAVSFFIREQLEVFYPIIGFYTVDMMNYFFGFQKPAELLFHYKAVFSHVFTTNPGVGMISAKNHNITTWMKDFATFPRIALFTFQSLSTFLVAFLALLCACFNSFITTGSRASKATTFYVRRRIKKIFSTYKAFVFHASIIPCIATCCQGELNCQK